MWKIWTMGTAKNNALEFHDDESSLQNDLEEVFNDM